MNMPSNYIAVLVAAVAAYATGAIWYMALGKPWMNALGKTREELQGRSMTGYVGAFVAALVASLILALFIVNLPSGGLFEGAVAGVLAALGFGVTAFLSDALFAGRGLKLWAINSGHQVVALGIAGAILGAWR